MKDEYGEIIELIMPMYKDKIRTIDIEASSGEIVRCKDCVNAEHERVEGEIWCPVTCSLRSMEWFCADGKKR